MCCLFFLFVVAGVLFVSFVLGCVDVECKNIDFSYFAFMVRDVFEMSSGCVRDESLCFVWSDWGVNCRNIDFLFFPVFVGLFENEGA